MSEEEAWRYRDTQGRLFCAVEGRLVGDGGTVLPNDGVAVGEVQVRGPWITGSYYKDDDPGKFDHGWLRTGDVGTIDRLGYVTLTDRAKDVIKSGGEWISSMELENILMGHPEVAEAAVIGVPDEKWGERPLATVVIREGATITPKELKAYLADQVPRWQLPERWSFIDGGTEDQRREVREDADPGGVRGRRLRRGRGAVTPGAVPGPGGREPGRPDPGCFGTSAPTALARPAASRYADADRLVVGRLRLVRSMAPHC